MKLSVIIVSYNVKHYLEQCLRSLFKAAGDKIPMEVFVVDNASQDNSATHVEHTFPQAAYPHLHVIKNARNVGFGKANNQAVRKAAGEYILFLNPDTILTENTLDDVIKHADENPEAGGVGTMMLYSNGLFAKESRRGLPSPWTAFCKMSGLRSLFPKSRLFGKYYMEYLNRNKPAEIEIISGAFFLARHTALDKAGLFDEDFFMYGEDIDLSYRLLKQGFKNHYVPSPIIHYKGESTHKSTFRYVHIFYTAMLIFFKKHYGEYGMLLTLPIKLSILTRAAIAVVAQYMNRAHEFIFPPKEMQDYKYIYIGRNSDKIKAIAEKWCLDITYIDSDENTRTPRPAQTDKKVDYIIYDTTNFSYSYIVHRFKASDHRTKIGTFYPDSNLVITETETFTLPQDE